MPRAFMRELLARLHRRGCLACIASMPNVTGLGRGVARLAFTLGPPPRPRGQAMAYNGVNEPNKSYTHAQTALLRLAQYARAHAEIWTAPIWGVPPLPRPRRRVHRPAASYGRAAAAGDRDPKSPHERGDAIGGQRGKAAKKTSNWCCRAVLRSSQGGANTNVCMCAERGMRG